MLMYGKEASNQKQEIDRQHTLFRNKNQKISGSLSVFREDNVKLLYLDGIIQEYMIKYFH